MSSTGGDRYASPILASDFAQLLWLAIRKGLTGTHHLAGAERISLWQFARLMALADGAPQENSARDVRSANPNLDTANCDEETSLDSRRIQRLLSTPLPMLRDAMDRFIEQATNGHRDRLRSAWLAEAAAAA